MMIRVAYASRECLRRASGMALEVSLLTWRIFQTIKPVHTNSRYYKVNLKVTDEIIQNTPVVRAFVTNVATKNAMIM